VLRIVLNIKVNEVEIITFYIIPRKKLPVVRE